MTPAKNKMQLRAEIFSVLNYYSGDNPFTEEKFNSDVEKLSNIKEKDFLAQVIFKEIFSDNKKYADICANIAFLIFDRDIFQKFGIKFLEDKNLTDAKKFYFISLLDHKGVKIDYESLDFYIKDPSGVASEGIKEFLCDAIKDPESRIDLLDFYSNISYEEKLYLLDSLSREYSGDNLANAFSILSSLELDFEEAKFIADALLENDSYYSFKALSNILNANLLKGSDKIKVRTFLKNIELKYKNKPDYNLIGDSVPYRCYISFLDGNSDFTVVFSRKYSNGSIVSFLTTINLNRGITSCVGFYNIDHDYFVKIFKRLFTDSIPVLVDCYTANAVFKYFESKNIENNELPPYEFQVWKEFTGDLKLKNINIIEFFKSHLSTMLLDETKFKKMIKSKLIENWYFVKKQNKTVDKIIESILKLEIPKIKDIENIIEKNLDIIFKDKLFIDEIKFRLTIQAYVAFIAKFTISSSALYSVCLDEKYFREFVAFLIYKSVYVYFINSINSDEDDNIFRKDEKNNFTKNQINKIIKDIENKFE